MLAVFEYVPDSEEASASAAESLPDRIVSEDEAEFLERTQAFIANMQKLRQELQEEQVSCGGEEVSGFGHKRCTVKSLI